MSNELNDTITTQHGTTYSIIDNNTNLLLISNSPAPFILNVKGTSQDLLVKDLQKDSICLLRVPNNNFKTYYDAYPKDDFNSSYFLDSYRYKSIMNNLEDKYLIVFNKDEQDLRQVFKSESGTEQDLYNFKFLKGDNTYKGQLEYRYKDISLYSVPYNFTVNNLVGLTLSNDGSSKDYDTISTNEEIQSIQQETTYTRATIYHTLIPSKFIDTQLPNSIKDITLKILAEDYISRGSYNLTSDLNNLNVYDLNSYLCAYVLYFNENKVINSNFYSSDLDLSVIGSSSFASLTFNLKNIETIKLMPTSFYKTLNFSFPVFSLDSVPTISSDDDQYYTPYYTTYPVRLFSFKTKELYFEAMELYPKLQNLFTIDGVSPTKDMLYYKSYKHQIEDSFCNTVYMYKAVFDNSIESLKRSLSIIAEDTTTTIYQESESLVATDSSIKLNNSSSTPNITSTDSFVSTQNGSATITLPKGKLDSNYKIYNMVYSNTSIKLIDNLGNDLFDKSEVSLQGVDITRTLPFSEVTTGIPSNLNNYTYNNLSYDEAIKSNLIAVTSSSMVSMNELVIVKQKLSTELQSLFCIIYPLPLIKDRIQYYNTTSITVSSGAITRNSPDLLSFDFVVFKDKVYNPTELKDLVLKSGDAVYACTNYNYSNYYFHKIIIQNKKPEITLSKETSDNKNFSIIINSAYICNDVYLYFASNPTDRQNITSFLTNRIYFNSSDYRQGVYSYNPPLTQETSNYVYRTKQTGTLFVVTKDADNNDVTVSIDI